VYNRLKTFADKDEKQRARLHEKKEHSTSVMALDHKTRLIMYKLINGEYLAELNGVISTGKESVVFHGRANLAVVDADLASLDVAQETVDTTPSPRIEEVAIKVFKTTLTEFRQRQQFLHGDRRFEARVGKQSARKLVKLWAEKEMANLTRMHRAGIHCPRVVLNRKHILVMTFVGMDGTPAPKLKDVRLSQSKLRACYDNLVRDLCTMYQECRLVHCDLSEYNILYHQGFPWIIDVGQSVESTHPRALEYMYRDCVNVVKFFTKAGLNGLDANQLMKQLTGTTLSPEQESEYTHKISSGKAHAKTPLPGMEPEDSSRVCVDFDPAAAKMAGVALASEGET
jgi:RIO kinase 3